MCSCVVGTRVCLCARVVEGDTSCLPPSVSTLSSESELTSELTSLANLATSLVPDP